MAGDGVELRAGRAPIDRFVWHFTHIDNLRQILVDGVLYCDSRVGGRLRSEVGDRAIKADRRRYRVTCEPGGCPADYVPFYFAPRSPMLYRIARGGVEQYQDGQTPLVYLVSKIRDVQQAGLPWVFSNGNCGSPTTDYFNDLGLLDAKVDWNLQEALMWNDTADEPNRATRRAAEFLVHDRLPLPVIRWMGVRTSAMASAVTDLLGDAGSSQRVLVRPRWYFNGQKFR